MKKLILIEGLFGSGKSTTAEVLSRKLTDKGLNVTHHVEPDPQNPVGLPMSLIEADNTIKSTTLARYPFETWENLFVELDSFMLIEARLIQNSSFWAMLNGENEKKCIELPRKILNSISKDIEVKLIVFSQTNPESHIYNVINERKKKHPHWLPYICDLFDKQKWAKNNQARGIKGFVDAQLAWTKLFSRIVDNLECERILIIDPHTDWDEAMNKALKFSLV